ncbi:MAG: hypothetical protein PHG82_05755 [Candidatus Gracilibacteria bacterium]|nr:hypothetical protein [Candidatus Gracilibacteria bacterium]
MKSKSVIALLSLTTLVSCSVGTNNKTENVSVNSKTNVGDRVGYKRNNNKEQLNSNIVSENNRQNKKRGGDARTGAS